MKLKLTIDGKIYEVEVEVAEPEPPPAYVPPVTVSATTAPTSPSPTRGARPSTADESKVCRSPIAGVVVQVPAQVGQSIQPNDVLLVLEAMKMETVITAPCAGKIAKINAAVGESVQAKQVVVEFE